MNLEISKMLCLSTAHVSRKTSELLDLQTDDVPPAYDKSVYGWFISVQETDPPTCPSDLHQLLIFARIRGCQWLMLDRDGPVLSELQIFDW